MQFVSQQWLAYSVAHSPLCCTRVVGEVAVVVRYNRKKVLETTVAAVGQAPAGLPT